MTEATWDGSTSPAINWHMSVALENVPRGEADLPEVTSLEGAVRAWLELDAGHQAAAVLTLEHPIVLDGTSHASFSGEGIAHLAERLPQAETPGPENDSAA